MEDSAETNPFEELTHHDIVVAYETRDRRLYDILSLLSDDYVDINLGESDKLKMAFMDHFKLSELPVVIIKGSPVLDNLEEKISECLDEKERIVLERVQNIIDPDLVTIFIKGSPTEPRCGFTKSLIDVLRGVGLTESKLKHFDILSDEDIRKRLKEINNWPTFPQIYIKGKFVGGLDVIKKMDEKGQLREKLAGII